MAFKNLWEIRLDGTTWLLNRHGMIWRVESDVIEGWNKQLEPDVHTRKAILSQAIRDTDFAKMASKDGQMEINRI